MPELGSQAASSRVDMAPGRSRPVSAERSVREVRKGYLGISLGRLYYSTARLNAYCAWASVNVAPDFGFLIGDDIYAITLQAFSRMSEKRALDRARQKGDDIARQLAKIGTARGLAFTIVRWRELTARERYQAVLTAATALRDNDEAFRQALRQQAVINLKRRFEHSGPPTARAERMWRLLETYVIHEIAGLITMSEDLGYAVEVYPGPDLDVVRQIYDGKWRELRSVLPVKPVRGFCRLELD